MMRNRPIVTMLMLRLMLSVLLPARIASAGVGDVVDSWLAMVARTRSANHTVILSARLPF
jgi:hypothetical protein